MNRTSRFFGPLRGSIKLSRGPKKFPHKHRAGLRRQFWAILKHFRDFRGCFAPYLFAKLAKIRGFVSYLGVKYRARSVGTELRFALRSELRAELRVNTPIMHARSQGVAKLLATPFLGQALHFRQEGTRVRRSVWNSEWSPVDVREDVEGHRGTRLGQLLSRYLS